MCRYVLPICCGRNDCTHAPLSLAAQFSMQFYAKQETIALMLHSALQHSFPCSSTRNKKRKQQSKKSKLRYECTDGNARIMLRLSSVPQHAHKTLSSSERQHNASSIIYRYQYKFLPRLPTKDVHQPTLCCTAESNPLSVVQPSPTHSLLYSRVQPTLCCTTESNTHNIRTPI
jgi:hypothetical protein